MKASYLHACKKVKKEKSCRQQQKCWCICKKSYKNEEIGRNLKGLIGMHFGHKSRYYSPVELLKLTLFVSKFSVVEDGEGDERLPCYVKLGPTALLAPTHCLGPNILLLLLLHLLFDSLSAHSPLDPSLSPAPHHNTTPHQWPLLKCVAPSY
jgi:hypothetical protein